MKIFADWGTSNLRAWLVNDAGEVVRRYSSDKGLLAAAGLGFKTVFDEAVHALEAEPDTPALIFGMAGSQKGWAQVPYTPTPADAQAIASSTRPVPDRPNTRIVGGVSHQLTADRPEVMRGEEVQALGALALQPDTRWLCMPGTHTKWVRIDQGNIAWFATFMTGELFAWLTRDSIIATQIEGAGFDHAGFDAGLSLAHEGGALTSALFQLRTRYLAGSIKPEQVRSAASGLLIGHELSSVREQIDGPVAIVASPPLAEPYRVACERVGVDSLALDPERCAVSGLLCLLPLINDGQTA